MCFLKVGDKTNKRLGAMNKLNIVHSGWMTKSPPEHKLQSPLKIFRAVSLLFHRSSSGQLKPVLPLVSIWWKHCFVLKLHCLQSLAGALYSIVNSMSSWKHLTSFWHWLLFQNNSRPHPFPPYHFLVLVFRSRIIWFAFCCWLWSQIIQIKVFKATDMSSCPNIGQLI